MARRTDFRKATTYTGQKIKGQFGGFDTAYGKVTAFTDDMRKQLWDNHGQYIGRMMEVQYKELFESGSFLRFRDDKDTESFDTKGDMK